MTDPSLIMFYVLIALLVVWGIITVVGHLSWLAMAAVARLFWGKSPSSVGTLRSGPVPNTDSISEPVHGADDEIEVTIRVLRQVQKTGRLSTAETLRLIDLVRKSAVETADPFPDGDRRSPTPAMSDEVFLRPPAVSTPGPVPAKSEAFVGNFADSVDSEDLVPAVIVPEDPWGTASEEVEPAAVSGKYRAEVIRSFLASHNIRWGELIAGVLIVACSVGLVISLWNTIVSTHRVVPSLVMMAGNAAVFAAGLYTLGRWKLRHTSRAVLVIATLLVPLSVLAGLAAGLGGEGAAIETVNVTDPLTLGSLTIVLVVYTVLLHRGSCALVGRALTLPLMLSVGGAVVVLPLLPAFYSWIAARAIGTLSIAAIAVLTAMGLMITRAMRRPAERRLGNLAGRNHLLVVAIAVFSLGVSVAYANFLLGLNREVFLPVSITLIPALVGLAGGGALLHGRARRVGYQITGLVATVLLLGLAWMLLPMTLASAREALIWAITLSFSLILVGYWLRSTFWQVLANFPVGIVWVLSAAPMVRGLFWRELTLFEQLCSGEAMVAGLLWASFMGMLSRIWRRRKVASSPRQSEPTDVLLPQRWGNTDEPSLGRVREWFRTGGLTQLLLLAGGIWLLGSSLIAATLTILPTEFLGPVSMVLVTTVLLTTALVAMLFRGQWNPSIWMVIAASGFAWAAVVRPFVLPLEDWTWSPQAWMRFGMFWAATLLALQQFARWIVPPTQLRLPQHPHASGLAIRHLSAVVIGLSIAVSVLACGYASDSYHWSVSVLAVAAGLSSWSAVLQRCWGSLQLGQMISLAMMIVIGLWIDRDLLLSGQAWSRGDALWMSMLVCAATSGIWTLVRQGLVLGWPALADTMVEARRSLDQRLLDAASWLALLAGLTAVTGQLALENLDRWFINRIHWAVPLSALLVTGTQLIWRHRRGLSGPGDRLVTLLPPLFLGLVFWGACQLSQLGAGAGAGAVPGTTVLIWQCLMTTTGVLLGLLCWLLLGVYQQSQHREETMSPRQHRLFVMQAATSPLIFPALLFVTLAASASILWSVWMPEVLNGRVAPILPIATLSMWWVAGSIVLSVCQILRGWNFAMASAILMMLAAAIMPTTTAALPWAACFQIGILSSIAWIGMNRWVLSGTLGMIPTATERRLLGWVMAAGLVTAVGKSLEFYFGAMTWSPLTGAVAVITAFVGCGLWIASLIAKRPSFLAALSSVTGIKPLSMIPLGLALLAGQMVWLLLQVPSFAGFDPLSSLISIWCSALAIGLVWYANDRGRIPFIFCAIVSALLLLLTFKHGDFVSTLFHGQMLTAAILLGCLVALVGREPAGHGRARFCVVLAWLVVVLGGWHVLQLSAMTYSLDTKSNFSLLVLWLAGWIIFWRITSLRLFDRQTLQAAPFESWGVLADGGLMGLLSVVAICDAFALVFVGEALSYQPLEPNAPQWWRLLGYVAAAAFTVVQPGWRATWSRAFICLLASVAIITLQAADILFAPNDSQRIMLAIVSPAFALTLFVFRIAPTTRLLHRRASGWITSLSAGTVPLLDAARNLTLGVITLGTGFCVTLILSDADPRTARLTVVAVILGMLSLYELSELTGRSGLRYLAVATGLLVVGLLASIVPSDSPFPLLHATMQWFVATVFLTGFMALVLPRLFGARLLLDWHAPLAFGTRVTLLVCCLTLVIMLGLEFQEDHSPRLAQLPGVLIIGVGFLLGIQSLILAAIAVMTGPGFRLAETLQPLPWQRRALIYASQGLALVTWLHFHLCNYGLFFAALSVYWPFVVLLLAFIGVGLTQWASRREDSLLADTLAPTALYLPLVPAIGFWISGQSIRGGDWFITGSNVPYVALLMVATGYYVFLCCLWRRAMPKIGAILLGNASLWVILAQREDWSFWLHPQAWLIPPAVCVLVVTHLNRRRIGPQSTAAVRYAATLLIYVASTADMFVQQVGTSLSGPMILIGLSLAGVLTGIVLRIRPFLYLGAGFVLLGVLSMVWHAQVAIDAVWPWWVFGIGSGIGLLVGLMWLEKNRPKLQRYTAELARWEG